MIFLNKNKYTSIELCILIFILLNSFTSTILINSFKDFSTIEILLSILIFLILGYLLINIIIKVYNDNFIINSINNRIIKLIIILILISLATLIIIYSLFYSSSIIKDILLPNNDMRIIYFLILFTAFFLARKGTKSIVIASNLLFGIEIIIFIITIIFSILNIDPINLLPLNFKIEKLNFLEILSYSIAPICLTLIISKNEINNFNDFKLKFKRTYLLFCIYLIIKILLIISILGIKYTAILRYPEITLFKSINIFNFFKKFEEILIINIFIQNFILISLSINYINQLLNMIKQFKNITIIIPFIIFLIIININELNNNYLLISNCIFIIINLFLYNRKSASKY